MFDLVLNLILLFTYYLREIVANVIFRPPNPPSYKVISETENNYKRLYIYSKKKQDYIKVTEFSFVDYELVDIPLFKFETKITDENIDAENFSNEIIKGLIVRPKDFINKYIIYSHGNSCDIGISYIDVLELACQTNYCVILYEYQGYGETINEKFNEETIYSSIKSVYKFVNYTLSIHHTNIFLYGHSLGTGPTIDLASNSLYPVAGIILQSPFTSCVRTVLNIESTLWFDFFVSIEKVSKIKSKVFIFHGTKDNIVPIEHSLKLISELRKDMLFEFLQIEGGDHNYLFKNHKNLIFRNIRKFLTELRRISERESISSQKSSDFNNMMGSELDEKKNIIENCEIELKFKE